MSHHRYFIIKKISFLEVVYYVLSGRSIYTNLEHNVINVIRVLHKYNISRYFI